MGLDARAARTGTKDQRIADLEHNVRSLADALAFVMQKLDYKVESPIIGGEPKVLSMMELYRASVDAKAKALQAIRDARAESGTVQ